MIDVERGLISKLLETRDISPLKDAQIKITFFHGDNRVAYQFIQDCISKTGEIPTIRAFRKRFPQYKLETHTVEDEEIVGTDENMLYWCGEVRTKVKHNSIAEGIDDAVEKLQDFKTDEAYSVLKKTISFVENEVEETEDIDLTKGVEDRVKAYLERKNNKGMRGIPSGLLHFDYLTKGFEPETLTTIIANTGIGKRLDLNTPILTPEGFTPLRDIHVNSSVFGEDGEVYKVLLETPIVNTQVYRVSFEDGTHVDCCSDHLWKFKTTDDVSRKKDWRVRTTAEILREFPLKRGKLFNLCIPVNDPIQFEDKDLPLSPYALGCLLGDGGFTTDSLTFTNPEEDLIHKLNNSLDPFGKFLHRNGNEIQCVYKAGEKSLFRCLESLNLIGRYSIEKFIPTIYLQGSVEQRKMLLTGLIDTDGSINAKGHTSFSTSSERLRDDFVFLVRSLGYRCRSHEYLRGGKENVEYSVIICTDEFLGSTEKHKYRYQNAKKGVRKNYYKHLKITDIEVLDKFVDMKCLSVNSPDHTFICGDFIVTHNTWFQVLIGANCMLQNCRVLQFVTEMSGEQMRDRYEAVLFAKCYSGMNYNAFKAGNLSIDTEKQYFQFLREDLTKFEPLILSVASGVLDVSAKIESIKPDLVLIDSAYLMEDDQGAKDDWLRVAHITRDLKKLSKRAKVPIVINTQADKSTSKKTGPEMDSIMYTQAIGQDSDCVIALYRDELMINDREMCVKLLKQREGSLGKVMIHWDFDDMNFREIYMDTSEEDPTNNTLGEEVLD